MSLILKDKPTALSIKSSTNEYSKFSDEDFLIHHMKCQKCISPNPQIPQGFMSSPVLVIGRTFNFSLNSKNSIYIRPFEAMLSVLNLRPQDAMYTAAIGCRINTDFFSKYSLEHCALWKSELLKRMPNLKLVLLMGADAYRQFYGEIESVTRFMGYLYKTDVFGRDVFVLPLPSPVYLSRDRSMLRTTLSFMNEVRKITGEDIWRTGQ